VMLQEERPFETPSLPQEMTPDDGDTLSPEASKEMDFWLKGSVQKIWVQTLSQKSTKN